jgi:hypothetical protein
MKPTKQQIAAEAFSRKTEKLDRQRRADIMLQQHRERTAFEANLAAAQAEWDLDHPSNADIKADAEMREAAEGLGIQL